MAGDLPDVLRLLHDSARRWRTLRAEGQEWQDEQRSAVAFARRQPPGAVLSTRGAPGPPQEDGGKSWRLWVRQPHHVRVEFGVGHGVRITEIANATHRWATMPDGRSRMQKRHAAAPLEFGPAAALIDTRGLSAAFDLQVIGPTEGLGRAAVALVAHPHPGDGRLDPRAFHPVVHGADEVRMAVDAERGVVLRLEAFLGDAAFYRVEMTDAAFDEELPDEVFALGPEADPPLEEAQPARWHEGPPDGVIGGVADVRTELVRTESIVIVVDRIVAYPSGFELHVTVRTRDAQPRGTVEPAHPRTWGGTAAFPGESLRLGVASSDLTVVPISGSGTPARFDQRFWVQPLPRPGPLGLTVEWAGRGVAQTHVDVPGDAIHDAASRATTLWR